MGFLNQDIRHHVGARMKWHKWHVGGHRPYWNRFKRIEQVEVKLAPNGDSVNASTGIDIQVN